MASLTLTFKGVNGSNFNANTGWSDHKTWCRLEEKLLKKERMQIKEKVLTNV